MPASKTVVQVLREAKYAIAIKGWTQGYYARNADGRDVIGHSEGATCFCALGGIQYATKVRGEAPGFFSTSDLELRAKEYLGKALFKRQGPVYGAWHDNAQGMGFIPTYNDHPDRTVEEILSLFDEAIALALKDYPDAN